MGPTGADRSGWTTVDSVDELRLLLGEPLPHVVNKDRQSLVDVHRAWIAASPLCLVATASSDGTCDVSPKGDPAGFVRVLDDTTLAIPERPGNRRADGYRNLLSNPHVGLIFLVPGRPDTLRANGRGRLVSEAPFLDDMLVKGHRPVLALVVEVEQVFFHCSKAFLRSRLWDPATWTAEADGLPSRAQIAKVLDRPETPIEELERYYGPSYSDGLYRQARPGEGQPLR